MDKYTVYLPRYLAVILNARAFDKDAKACLISITEPDSPEAKLMQPWTDILRVAFWDVISPVPMVGGSEMFDPMTEDQAKVIAEFIKKHKDEHIIVHCKAGKSRSAAVVRLLLELGWKYHPVVVPLYNMEHHNIHVYCLLKKQFPELLPKGAV